MSLKAQECSKCGGHIEYDPITATGVCPSCGTPYYMETEQNIYNDYSHHEYNIETANIIVNTDTSIQKKLEEAEIFLEKIKDFSKGFQAFKKITDDTPGCWQAWWGKVRAQTKLLTKFFFESQNGYSFEFEQICNDAHNAILVLKNESDKASVCTNWRDYIVAIQNEYTKNIQEMNKKIDDNNIKIQENDLNINKLKNEISAMEKQLDIMKKQADKSKKQMTFWNPNIISTKSLIILSAIWIITTLILILALGVFATFFGSLVSIPVIGPLVIIIMYLLVGTSGICTLVTPFFIAAKIICYFVDKNIRENFQHDKENFQQIISNIHLKSQQINTLYSDQNRLNGEIKNKLLLIEEYKKFLQILKQKINLYE